VNDVASANEISTLSIDIGTTTVVAARTNEGPSDNSTEIVVRMPAIVGVHGGEVLTGDAAVRLATTHPDQTVSQLIRRFGDSSPIILDGQAFSIAELLGHVVSDVVTQAAVEPASTRLVLTHPAAWKDHRLAQLTSLGATQGFATVDVVSDAIAATNPLADTAPARVLVVDVGGGTVDVSVVAIEVAGATLLATQSLERLGGNDFDQAVFGHVMASVDNMIADLDRRDPAVRQALLNLRANCTTAKEHLSTDTDAPVAVSIPGLDTAVRITRAEFESVIRPQVEAIITLVDRVVASSGVGAIDRVIATGGSATVPLIGETLSGHLGQSVAAGDDPATATVRGATILPIPPSITDHETEVSTTTSPERGTTMNDDAPTAPDSATAAGGAVAPPESGSSGTKRAPIAPPPTAEKQGTSTGAKVAVGATAAAAAAAAAVVFGDDVAAALGNDDGPDASVPPADPTAPADPIDDDGMDEFDAVVSAPAVDGAGPQGVPVDSPIAAAAAVRQDRPRADRDSGDDGNDRPAPHRPPPNQTADAPDFAAAANAPGTRAAGAAAAPSAPSVTAESADVAVDGDAGDAQFEAARATLLERLENFEAPAGTSPEDAAELRQELVDAVERFQPRPGESTEAALAAMRDDFDRRVQDFVQDQKIDALVDEAERDNQAEAAAAAPATTTPEAPPVAVEVPDDPASTLGDPAPTLGDPVSDSPGADPGGSDRGAPGALVDDFDTAAGRFEVAPDLIESGVTSTATLDPALPDTADTIGVGLLDPDAIQVTRPDTADFTAGRESIAFGDAAPVDGGNLDAGLLDAPLVAGDRPLDDFSELDVAPIAVLDTDQAEAGDGGEGGDGEPGTVIQRDDFVGDSVYNTIVESPLTLIDVPSPEAILIGLDQPAPSDIDPDGLQVRAELPDDFVPPEYVEPDSFLANVPIVQESVSDFGIEGLEDEGNLPVDDVPDDMLEG
jgi:actin-like ATPase involved in cell morphogenesis